MTRYRYTATYTVDGEIETDEDDNEIDLVQVSE